MSEIIKKLDLQGYIERFEGFLARKKPLFLNGDARQNYARIEEIAKHDLTLSPKVANLDDVLARLGKFATLHISEIFEISKILGYFDYLKRQKFEGSFAEWLGKITFPPALATLAKEFDEEGELKEVADERLGAVARELGLKKEQITSELRRLIYTKSIQPYLVDSQVHFVEGCETILVRGGFNHALKGSVIARSASGFFYVMPSVVSALKNEEAALLDKKQLIIYEYCKKVSAQLTKNLPFCKFINNAFDYADALIARCEMAKSGDLEFVLSSDKSEVVLSEFCHPALKNPKPISIEFTENVLLITGVNAGGKSMLLKSVLSAAFLAKHLLPMRLNAQKSSIGRFGEFECIIEDPQNSRNDISTFAGRMVAFSRLFGKKKILVGVDEIELGTDFEEAASLYLVLIRQLVKNGVKLVVTTHHKRLAMLLGNDDGVGLVAALYDEANSRPKFEFLKGLIGKSYAFETALRYGISPALVAEAKKNYGEENENLGEIISKTLNLQIKLKKELRQTQKKEAKLDALIASTKSERQSVKTEFSQSKIQLEREFNAACDKAKSSIKQSMLAQKQREFNASKLLAKQAAQNAQNSGLLGSGEVSFSVGERVKYGNTSGVVTALVGNNEALIDADGVRMRLAFGLLKKLPQNQQKATSDSVLTPKIAFTAQKPTQAKMTLDLHGIRAQEALEKVDKFLSDALLAGFDEVSIKHGIGGGTLCGVVREFLKTHPRVKGYKDAPAASGGFGTTIVSL